MLMADGDRASSGAGVGIGHTRAAESYGFRAPPSAARHRCRGPSPRQRSTPCSEGARNGRDRHRAVGRFLQQGPSAITISPRRLLAAGGRGGPAWTERTGRRRRHSLPGAGDQPTTAASRRAQGQRCGRGSSSGGVARTSLTSSIAIGARRRFGVNTRRGEGQRLESARRTPPDAGASNPSLGSSWRGSWGPVVGLDDPRHEVVAHDVGEVKRNDLDPAHALEQVDGVAPGPSAGRRQGRSGWDRR